MFDLSDIVRLPRSERAAALARAVPEAAGAVHPADTDPADTDKAERVGPWATGGRRSALDRLASIDPVDYARTRNHVGGAVTRLSPWLRHGVLSLAEVRDAALARVTRPEDAAKLISELGWRDYWQQVYASLGDRIRKPIEPPAHTSRLPQVDQMPADVLAAQTGMHCIDAFVRQLHQTGWLHNHQRMWLASWLVHVRGVRWQAGADWFLTHLLDGDPASNHLSWQWVAGTFSAKPYIFNRENLESFTNGSFCQPCGLRGSCDVEGSYESLADRWFAPGGPASREPLRIRPREDRFTESPQTPAQPSAEPLVWLTLDSVAATSPAATAHPQAPRLFVIDPEWISQERPSLNRLIFLFECLADIPGVEVILGDPHEAVPARGRAHGCERIVMTETPCPRIRRAVAAIESASAERSEGQKPLPVTVVPWPQFCDRSRVRDLGRFSRYWREVEHSAMRPTATEQR
jgi:deoxyribodipyrimidine photo-lyase